MQSTLWIPVLFVKGERWGLNRDGLSEADGCELAAKLRDKGADALLIKECSENDGEHEASILGLRKLVRTLDLPLYVCGGIHRFEDVKKYLYAGAVSVYCDPADEAEQKAYTEAVARFGEKKVKCSDLLAEAQEKDGVYSVLVTGEKAPAVSFTFADVKTDEKGLVPVVVQDFRTNEVLMLAYMNEEAFNKTVSTGIMTYFSRSRQSLWVKGETSGHFQYVKSLWMDCDNDTILAKVYQIGAACHTNNYSCFYRSILEKPVTAFNPEKVLEDVYAVIMDRKAHPKEGSYTNYLFDKGIDKILKKCGEEATEIVIAAKNPKPDEIIYEIADFLYHVSVLMAVKDVTWEDILLELANRE